MSAARQRRRSRGCSRRSETKLPYPETAAGAPARPGRRECPRFPSSARDAPSPKKPSARRTRSPSGAHLSPASSSLVGWLGRKDSNLRIRDPKSRALPLGHAPTRPETSREILGETDLWSGHSHAAQTISLSDGLISSQLSSSRARPPEVDVIRANERPRQEYPSSG